MNKKINIHCNLDSLEYSAKKQFDECCSHDFVLEAALMPDAHSGYVAPIGSVIKTKSAIVPSWVGYDIGCGMIAVKISDDEQVKYKIKLQSLELFDCINDFIPMGAGRHNDDSERVFLEDRLLKEISNLRIILTANDFFYGDDYILFKKVSELSRLNLGTLGSGNHFIEILDNLDETWLVIHSGSRGVGHFLGTHFMKKASGLDKKFEETYAITDKLLKMQYMIFQNYCLEFALLNRLSMAHKVFSCIEDVIGIRLDVDANLWVNKNHNHCIEIEPDVYLHRKGATSSELGERGVIPANMKDGCFLVEGLGNVDFLNSSSHGAGRALSRGETKRKITLEQFQKTMNGIVAPVNKDTIDESPEAYKNIFEVMELQKGSVKVLKHLKPIINWKGY